MLNKRDIIYSPSSSSKPAEHKERYSEECGKLSSSGSWYFFPTMEVNGALKQPGSSKYLPLCLAEQRHSYRFGNTWGWVNDDMLLKWTIPLMLSKTLHTLRHPLRCLTLNGLQSYLFEPWHFIILCKRSNNTMMLHERNDCYKVRNVKKSCPVDVQVVQKCVKLGAKKAMYVTGDMSDPADPERVFTYAVEKLGEKRLRHRTCEI